MIVGLCLIGWGVIILVAGYGFFVGLDQIY